MTAVAAGVRRQPHLDDYPLVMAQDIRDALWQELRHEGLIDASAPVPAVA